MVWLNVLALVAFIGSVEWWLCWWIARNAPILDGDAALPPESRR